MSNTEALVRAAQDELIVEFRRQLEKVIEDHKDLPASTTKVVNLQIAHFGLNDLKRVEEMNDLEKRTTVLEFVDHRLSLIKKGSETAAK